MAGSLSPTLHTGTLEYAGNKRQRKEGPDDFPTEDGPSPRKLKRDDSWVSQNSDQSSASYQNSGHNGSIAISQSSQQQAVGSLEFAHSTYTAAKVTDGHTLERTQPTLDSKADCSSPSAAVDDSAVASSAEASNVDGMAAAAVEEDQSSATRSQNTQPYAMESPVIDAPPKDSQIRENTHSLTATVNPPGSTSHDALQAATAAMSQVSSTDEAPCSESQSPKVPSSGQSAGQSAGGLNIMKYTMKKIPSVQRDTEAIASILGTQDMDILYAKLCQMRTHPNRVEVVTNAVLEERSRSEEDRNIEQQMQTFLQDVQTVLQQLDEHGIKGDPNEVYALLETNLQEMKRVELVTAKLLGNTASNHVAAAAPEDKTPDTSVPKQPPHTLVDDVHIVMKQCPEANPDEVYTLLESAKGSADPVAHVVGMLQRKPGLSNTSTNEDPKIPSHSKPTSPSEPTSTATQPTEESIHNKFMSDLDTVCKVCPDRDKNEIYALLESCPRQGERVQLVIKQLLGVKENPTDSSSMEVDGPDWNSTQSVDPFQGAHSSDPLAQLKKDVVMLMAVVPDCDPNYLFEELETRYGNPDRVSVLSSQLLEERRYPRLKDRLDKEQRQAQRLHLHKAKLNMEEFLQAFPEPTKTFYDISITVSDNYRRHAEIYLSNTFPLIHRKYINKLLAEYNHHLTPTLHVLEDTGQLYYRGERQKCFRVVPRVPDEMPDDPDEYFFKEVIFTRHEQEITMHLEELKRRRDDRIAEARVADALQTCTCCYEDELLFEDMKPCPEGHIFCKNCIKRMAEAALGDGRTTFPCLEGDCNEEFPLSVLQSVLSSKTFSILLRKRQEEEIKQADIADLETCPFCSFATIMPNPNDKIFHCLNPECFKESCRLCKEASHIPLRCEEVEKLSETRIRTEMELRMSEAMLRTCPRCKKRFYKTEGCNYMTCTCGQAMCYICREPIQDPGHFRGAECNLGDMDELHRAEMEAAGKAAIEELKKTNPGIEIKQNPEQLLDTLKPGRMRRNLNLHDNEAANDYDEGEGSDASFDD